MASARAKPCRLCLLDPPERRKANMMFVERIDHASIARKLGVPITTVDAHEEHVAAQVSPALQNEVYAAAGRFVEKMEENQRMLSDVITAARHSDSVKDRALIPLLAREYTRSVELEARIVGIALDHEVRSGPPQQLVQIKVDHAELSLLAEDFRRGQSVDISKVVRQIEAEPPERKPVVPTTAEEMKKKEDAFFEMVERVA